MKKLISLVLALVVTGLLTTGCASTRLEPKVAEDTVQKMLVLYKENKSKYIMQKQELQKMEDCGKITSLREAIDKMVKDASLDPEDTTHLTIMQMEMKQAEEVCLKK
ncbi:hypothetical protein KAI87_13560 [Myxococcota bacterium]|nr:hypothetical protein [Myxococcota bacterium]